MKVHDLFSRAARRALSALIVCTFTPPAFAQDAGTPSEAAPVEEGPVADETAPPVEAAPVEAVPVEAAPVEAVPTGKPAPPAGEPVAPPVEEAAPVVTVNATAVPNTPEPDAIEVTIIGTSLARTAGSAHIVNSRQMERFEYDDPASVLAAVPGVYLRGEDGFGLRPNIGIRGVDPDRSQKITLMEDGILFGPAPYSAPAAYYFPLITRMTQVRVIKGPGATSFGPQTVGGAIDLVTRSIPSSLAGRADLSFGEYMSRKAHVFMGTSTDDGRVGFLVEGIHLANDGFKELPNGGDTGFYRNEVMVKGAYNFAPAAALLNELRLKVTYSEELSNETYLGLSDADFRDNPLARYQASALDQMKNHRTSIVLTHAWEPLEHVSLTTNVYRHDYARIWRKANRFGGLDLLSATAGAETSYRSLLIGEQDTFVDQQRLWIGPNQREFVSEGIESRLHWDLNDGPVTQRIEAAVRLHHDQIDRHHSESPFQLIGGDVFPVTTDNSPMPVTSVKNTTVNRGSGTAFAFNVGDAITWNSLTVTPGLRFEAIRLGFSDYLADTSHSQWVTVLLPGIGAYYGITEEFGVLAGAYRGFSAPAPADIDNDSEFAVNYEAGARYTRGSSRAELIGFYNDYSNMKANCTECAAEMADVQFSAGEARIFGIEAMAQHEARIGDFRLPIQVSYTIMRAEFLNSFESRNPAWRIVTAGDEIPYVPRHQLNATLGVEHKRAGANVAINYVSSMREAVTSGPLSEALHTDSQFTVDLAARYQLFKNIEIYATARNLFNAIYLVGHRPYGARPNAPRWVQIGAKFDL